VENPRDKMGPLAAAGRLRRGFPESKGSGKTGTRQSLPKPAVGSEKETLNQSWNGPSTSFHQVATPGRYLRALPEVRNVSALSGEWYQQKRVMSTLPGRVERHPQGDEKRERSCSFRSDQGLPPRGGGSLSRGGRGALFPCPSRRSAARARFSARGIASACPRLS